MLENRCLRECVGAAWLVLGYAGLAAAQVQALPPSLALPSPSYPPYQPGGVVAGPPLAQRYLDFDVNGPGVPGTTDGWCWQVLPAGFMYRYYLAGVREPRLGTVFFYAKHLGAQWESTLGARVGILRFGSQNDAWPEGFQLDMEGAAFPRLNLEEARDLDAVDYQFGFPLTFRRGRWEGKIGYRHVCSHMGDELIIRVPGSEANRINYVRETLFLGLGFRPVPEVRLYAEADYAFCEDGGAEPWEFQFGAEYSPLGEIALGGAPFLAVHGHLRQEVNFGGNLAVQTGWQWRSRTGQLLRVGLHYFNGKSNQYQFYNTFEQQIGMGLWYDF